MDELHSYLDIAELAYAVAALVIILAGSNGTAVANDRDVLKYVGAGKNLSNKGIFSKKYPGQDS